MISDAVSHFMLFQTFAALNNFGNRKRSSDGLEDESDDNMVHPARESKAGRVIIKPPKKIHEDIPRRRQKTSRNKQEPAGTRSRSQLQPTGTKWNQQELEEPAGKQQ